MNTIKAGLFLTLSSFFLCIALNLLPPLKLNGYSFDVIKFLANEFSIFIDKKLVAIQFSWILSVSITSIITAYVYPIVKFKIKVSKIYIELLKDDMGSILTKQSRFKNKFQSRINHQGLFFVLKNYYLYRATDKYLKRLVQRLYVKARVRYQTKILGKILKDSPLDRLLFDAFNEKKLLMFTLKNRQVYIGRVSSTGEPTENKGVDQEVCLIPIMSGYRDDKSLSVDLITHYNKIEKNIYLTLRQEEIISATEFDLDAYENFKHHKSKKKGLSFNLEW
ncbi:hypothetical protein [Pseudoalteromonas sp. P1-13-1a]|uniref:hypothetical protein n=1 Tax=Pseudoalteromonas sp. P1-13-1a TaxID=1723756 RepID=UPI00128FADC3|nr:hypothetical protein [Pseudoalteromonas sp. P1-13-1a]